MDTSKLPIHSLELRNVFGLSSISTRISWIWGKLGTLPLFKTLKLKLLKMAKKSKVAKKWPKKLKWPN